MIGETQVSGIDRVVVDENSLDGSQPTIDSHISRSRQAIELHFGRSRQAIAFHLEGTRPPNEAHLDGSQSTTDPLNANRATMTREHP